jgi:hypothetical protein
MGVIIVTSELPSEPSPEQFESDQGYFTISFRLPNESLSILDNICELFALSREDIMKIMSINNFIYWDGDTYEFFCEFEDSIRELHRTPNSNTSDNPRYPIQFTLDLPNTILERVTLLCDLVGITREDLIRIKIEHFLTDMKIDPSNFCDDNDELIIQARKKKGIFSAPHYPNKKED